MSEVSGEGGGGGAAATVSSSAESSGGISSHIESPISPISPETTIQPGMMPKEGTADNATGIGIADTITKNSDVAPGDLLQNIADGKTFTASQDAGVFKDYQQQMRTKQVDDNEPSIKPGENPVTFEDAEEYRKNFASAQPEDTDTATTEPNKTDVKELPAEDNGMTGEQVLAKMNKDADAATTHENWKKIWNATDTDSNKAVDQAEPTAEDKKRDEKNEDPKSEQEKHMKNIKDQMKDINPNFDPEDPETKKFLEDLNKNPDQMKTVSEKFDKVNEQSKTIEDLADKVGIDSSRLKAFILNETVQNDIQQLTKKIEQSNQEQATNPDPQKQEENKKDSILLMLLKALGKAVGTALVITGATVLAAAKDKK